MDPPDEMPPSPAPGQRWVALCRRTCTDPCLPPGTGFCLAVGSRPPGVTDLLVSPLVDGGSGAVVRNPCVVAADPSGFLLLSGSEGDIPARAPYFLCNAVSNTVRQLPELPEYEYYANTGKAGLIVSDNDNFMVVDLVVPAHLPVVSATLRCFSPQTRGVWIQETLPIYGCLLRFHWCTDRVLSCGGKICWIDFSQGILSYDPALPLTSSQRLCFVPFPNLRPQRRRELGGQRAPIDPSTQRAVHVSDGKLRYTVVTTRARVPKIKLWTLPDLEASEWMLDHEVSFDDIWADQNYQLMGLSNMVPVCALIHPNDPHVVYFFQKERLFSFNLYSKTAIEGAVNDIDIDEASSGFLLAWELPTSLQISQGPLPSTSAFDRLASSFCDAFDRALIDMEFHQFTRIVIAHLNKDIRREENKLKVSDLLAISYFNDGANDQQKKYAHINFNARTGSKLVLVFGEFTKTEDRAPRALSSCTTLTKNCNGGLRDENVDLEHDPRRRKRKRSLYCFACMSELMHPKGGFGGGHDVTEAYR